MSEPIEANVVGERSVAALAPAVVEHSSALVVPAAGENDIVAAFRAYQSLKDRLLTDTDYQAISGKRFPKKSAWRKLGVAFGVSFDVKSVTHERDERGRLVRTEVVAIATAPNGRHSDGLGACDLYERCCQDGCRKGHRHCPASRGEQCNAATHFSNAQHDIPSTAETRAKNRAASDLFGFGEVSAEEMNADDSWWGGWHDEDEMQAAHEPLVAELRDAAPAVQQAVKAWREERGWKLPLPKDDFAELAIFARQLLAEQSVKPAGDAPHSPSSQNASPAPSAPTGPGAEPSEGGADSPPGPASDSLRGQEAEEAERLHRPPTPDPVDPKSEIKRAREALEKAS